MSTVYVLMQDYTYHEAGVIGVFSTVEKAKEEAERTGKLPAKGWGEYEGNPYCEMQVSGGSLTVATWIEAHVVDAQGSEAE